MTTNKEDSNKDSKEYRWAAEFLAGPGGYMERAEVVSDWFPSMEHAKEDAHMNAQKEVTEYPFSRGKILKLLVENKNGDIVELTNVNNNVPCRWLPEKFTQRSFIHSIFAILLFLNLF